MALGYMRQFLASEAFENAGREVSDVIPSHQHTPPHRRSMLRSQHAPDHRPCRCLAERAGSTESVSKILSWYGPLRFLGRPSPRGHVWVEGNNIYDSHDSRSFGPVPFSLI
ncbi:hypothetical protein DVH24_017457 [Malus domestica]|uniref:Uncharacterized protein n=1 Tax=Malus domestica TaxID=3750 RepID=A0A498IWA5_MALDO|nr:hypothetical protein DVH24_017457 [Malus domestica]